MRRINTLHADAPDAIEIIDGLSMTDECDVNALQRQCNWLRSARRSRRRRRHR